MKTLLILPAILILFTCGNKSSKDNDQCLEGVQHQKNVEEVKPLNPVEIFDSLKDEYYITSADFYIGASTFRYIDLIDGQWQKRSILCDDSGAHETIAELPKEDVMKIESAKIVIDESFSLSFFVQGEKLLSYSVENDKNTTYKDGIIEVSSDTLSRELAEKVNFYGHWGHIISISGNDKGFEMLFSNEPQWDVSAATYTFEKR